MRLHSITSLIRHASQYEIRHRPLYIVSLGMFFFMIFDGMMSYLTPIIISNAGYSNTAMGFIYGFSSFAGAVFDIILSKVIHRTSYRRIFFVMLASALFFPLSMMQGHMTFMILIGMAVWGLYYDLIGFGTFNFVTTRTPRAEHAETFGIIEIFRSIGRIIAPLMAALTIGSVLTSRPFFVAILFLSISMLIFILLYLSEKSQGLKLKPPIEEKVVKGAKSLSKMQIWKTLNHKVWTVFSIRLILNIFDAFIWALGPLWLSGSASGLFVMVYSLPIIIVGWFLGNITKTFGKKRTGFVSFIIGALIFSFIYRVSNTWEILAITFIASIFISLSWPAISGAMADYIDEKRGWESEIEGMGDLYANLGYVIGPMLAGFMSDKIGTSLAFSSMAIILAALTLILMNLTPRKIKL